MKKYSFIYEADHIKKIIYVDEESMKRASQISNPEFAELMKVRETLPDYELDIKKFPKKEKRTYAGLTIAVMQAFIIQCEDNIEKAESALRELNKEKAEGLLKGSAYGGAKSWFLDNYGKEYNSSAMSKKDSKRDALIAELIGKVDPSLIDPSAKIQKEGCVCNG